MTENKKLEFPRTTEKYLNNRNYLMERLRTCKAENDGFYFSMIQANNALYERAKREQFKKQFGGLRK